MSDSMIERVARILCDRECDDPDRLVAGEGKAVDKTWIAWQAYADDAREIIAAMRDPTDAMAKAVGGTLPEESIYGWHAMIDAALADG